MIGLEMKNHNPTLREKQQKYQQHHLEKVILHVKKYRLIVKKELKNKLSLHIHLLGKHLKNK